MKQKLTQTPLFILLIGCIAIIFSYYFIDKPIVYWASAHHMRNYHWLDVLTQIPKIFDYAAFIFALIILVIYVLNLPISRFKNLFFIASSIIIAAFLNRELKPIFSRYWPETWTNNNPSLLHDGVYGFCWFHGGPAYCSFPSGHTVVTVAAMTALTIIYPRLRWLAVIVTLTVALGLITLYYHFVSDVIAGGLLGYFTAKMTREIV